MAGEEGGLLLKGAHVLLVEDNDVNQALALDMLHSFSMRVDVVGNGADAVARVAQSNYDAVLMDCQMPGMDGYDATVRIRQDPRNADLPILAMTANVMQEEKEKCRIAGMNAHIAKPINMDDLFTTLAHWIKPAAHNIVAPPSDTRRPPDIDLPQLTGVDTARTLKRIGGDAARFRKLLTIFSQGQADTCNRIRDALGTGDQQTALLLIHTLRGLSATIGDDSLTAACSALERALRHEGDAEIGQLVAEVTASLQRLIQAIAHMQPSVVKPAQRMGATAFDLSTFAQSLRRLADLLRRNSSLATGEVERIAAMLDGRDMAPVFQHIGDLVGRYDFDQALMRLQDIARDLDVDL